MANHKSFLITASALVLVLISGFTVTNVVAAPSANAVEKKLSTEKRVDVRTKEEKRIARQDKSYAKQMKALAKQYKETAKVVKKQGGKDTALLEAAAYFERESKMKADKAK